MRTSYLPLLSLLALVTACAPNFESGSRLRTLRILAVQKDKPYARPGDTVTLRMLLDDATDSAPRPVTIAWFSGCENPPGDLYAGCTAAFSGAGGEADGSAQGTGRVGSGLEFSFPISDDIISRRPAPTDRTQPPYGTAYVFFAACAGELRVATPTADYPFPLACFSNSGKQLGSDDFVAGYSQVFVYDTLTNANPVVTGVTVDGKPVDPECIGEGCIALEREELGLPPLATDAGVQDPALGRDAGFVRHDAGPLVRSDAGSFVHPEAGASVAIDGGASAAVDAGTKCAPDDNCMDVCDPAKPDSCRQRSLSLIVDRASAEVDTLQASRDGRPLEEQMWINYYTTRGKLEHDVKLLNDTTTGWNEQHETPFDPPVKAGPFHVWAVVHDSRGGVEWARVRFVAQDTH
jgi:hypothetical protein